jgi:PAS domain S-box-containing protein
MLGEANHPFTRNTGPSRQPRANSLPVHGRGSWVIRASMDPDLSGLSDITQLTMLGDAWEHAEIGAVVFNDARRYLATNRAYTALTGYSGEEITDLRAGHNLLLEELGQAEFIERVTAHHTLGQAVIRRKDGTALPVSYMLTPSQVSQLPCHIGLVWPQDASDSP